MIAVFRYMYNHVHVVLFVSAQCHTEYSSYSNSHVDANSNRSICI